MSIGRVRHAVTQNIHTLDYVTLELSHVEFRISCLILSTPRVTVDPSLHPESLTVAKCGSWTKFVSKNYIPSFVTFLNLVLIDCHNYMEQEYKMFS